MSDPSDLFILGAGGFGREVLQHAREASAQGWPYVVKGFLDDDLDALSGFSVGVSVLNRISDEHLSGDVVIALGEPAIRRALRERVEAQGGRIISIVHPSAHVVPSATVGAGSIVGPGVYIGVDSSVEANVVLNVYYSVGHDAKVGSDSVLSSYTAVTGGVMMGAGCFTGTHATIAPGVSIGAWSKIAAGSVVTRQAPDGSLLMGNPAKGRVLFRAP